MERLRRRWWTWTVSLLAGVVVLGALLSAIFQLTVLAFPGYRDHITDFVSRAAGRPVGIGGVSLGWHALAPRLELSDVTVYSKDGNTPIVSATALALGFNPLRLVAGRTTPSWISIDGLELGVEIAEDGSVHIKGLERGGKREPDSRRELAQRLEELQSLSLDNTQIVVDDRRLAGERLHLRVPSAELRRKRDGLGFHASVLGAADGDTPLQLQARIIGDLAQPQHWSGEWSAQLDGYSGRPWIGRRLPNDFQVALRDAELRASGRIDQGLPRSVSAEFSAALLGAWRGDRNAQLRDLALHLEGESADGAWQLRYSGLRATGVEGPWPESAGSARIARGADRSWQLAGEIGFARIQDLTPWLALLGSPSLAPLQRAYGDVHALKADVQRLPAPPPPPPAAPPTVIPRAPAGDAPAIAAGSEPAPPVSQASATPSATRWRYDVNAQLAAAGLRPDGPQRVGVAGLAGTLAASEQGGSLRLSGGPVSLTMAKTFTGPLDFEALTGELHWARREGDWDLAMPALGWQIAGTHGDAQIDIQIPAEPTLTPLLDIQAQFSADDLNRLKPYIPLQWQESLRSWLTRAIEQSRVPRASLDIRGRLADFPYDGRPGVFRMDCDIADARVSFSPDWPALEGAAGHLVIAGRSLTLHADRGSMLGNEIDTLDARIPTFRESVLQLKAEARGSADRFYKVLRHSPLANKLSGLIDRSSATGPVRLQLGLEMPFKDVKQTRTQGVIRLDGVELVYSGFDDPMREVRGEVHFADDVLTADGLTAMVADVPVRARIVPQGDHRNLLIAEFDFGPRRDGQGPSRYVPVWLRPFLGGSAHWRAELPIGAQDPRLRFTSDSRGLSFYLPPPFGKRDTEARPLEFSIGSTPGGGTDFQLALQDVVGAHLQLVEDRAQAEAKPPGTGRAQERGTSGAAPMRVARGLVRVGQSAIPQLQRDGLYVDGHLGEADAIVWARTLGVGDNSQSPKESVQPASQPEKNQLDGVALDIDHLVIGHTAVDKANMHFAFTDDGWRLLLAGADTQGELRYARDAAGVGSLVSRFSALNLRAFGEPEPPPPAGANGQVEPPTPIDPARLPTLDLVSSKTQLRGAQFGEIVLRTRRIDGGQAIDAASVGGGRADLRAEGQWRSLPDGSQAQLSFDFTSTAMAEILSGLGYAKTLDARRAQFDGTLRWQAPDAAIDWARPAGELRLKVEDGALRAVDPGAGRVLGLLNFYALPRRLLLDFSDVTDKGLTFDRITGSFRLANGVASTSDLRIDATSVRIEVRGDVGLATRTYDERVTVQPEVSSGVTLGALLIGGPAAGALALLAQQVLNRPLDQVTRFSYRVTGPWENPQIERGTAEGDAKAPADRSGTVPGSGAASPQPQQAPVPPPYTTPAPH